MSLRLNVILSCCLRGRLPNCDLDEDTPAGYQKMVYHYQYPCTLLGSLSLAIDTFPDENNTEFAPKHLKGNSGFPSICTKLEYRNDAFPRPRRVGGSVHLLAATMDQSKLFNNCRNRWANVEDYFGFASAALMQAAKSIAASEDKSKEEITQKLELLKQYADRIAKLDIMCKSRARVSKELFNKSKDAPLEPGQIKEIYEQGLENTQQSVDQTSTSNHPELINIERILQKVSDGMTDNDIEEDLTTQQAPTLCPILRCALDNPMKNTECGHIYSLKGVIQLLMHDNAPRGRDVPETIAEVPNHFSARCPQFGCNKLLRPSSLKRDFATELTQRQQQGSAQEPESVEIEDF